MKEVSAFLCRYPLVSPDNIVHEFIENINHRYKIDIKLVIFTIK